MSVKKLTLAIVGCGSIAPAHAHAIQESPFATLKIVYAPREKTAQALAEKMGCTYTLNYDTILKDKSIDAVIITSPHFLHAAQAIAAMRAKKHVYLEKPIALSTTDVKKLCSTAQRNGVHIMPGHSYRYHAGAQAIKKTIDAGTLGHIYEIRMQFVADIYKLVVMNKWREDPQKSGGGALLELGIHEIDMLRFWLGKEPTRVYAEMSYRESTYPIERFACVTIGFEDTVCIIEAGYKKRTFAIKEIHGEKAGLTIRSFPDRDVTIFTDPQKGRPLEITDSPSDGRHKATTLFLEALAKDKPMPISIEDAQKSTNIMLAAYLSAKEKRVVTLPLKEKVVLPL